MLPRAMTVFSPSYVSQITIPSSRGLPSSKTTRPVTGYRPLPHPAAPSSGANKARVTHRRQEPVPGVRMVDISNAVGKVEEKVLHPHQSRLGITCPSKRLASSANVEPG